MRWIVILLLFVNVGYLALSYFAGGGASAPSGGTTGGQESGGQAVAVPTLILLSEQLTVDKRQKQVSKKGSSESDEKGARVPASPMSGATPAKRVKAAKPVLVCRQLGPIASEADAQRIVDFLSQQPVKEVVLKEQKVAEDKTYWLSLPLTGVSEPLADRIKKVKKVGLTTQKMTSGRLAGKTVAGPFISYEVAESYLFRLLALDVDMAIEPVVEVQFQYWVLVEWMYEPGISTPSSILSNLLEPLMKNIGDELQQNTCS